MSNNMILDRLEGVNNRFDEVGRLISEPDIVSDMKRYIKLNREYKSLEPIINVYKDYKNLMSNIAGAKHILATEKDDEMREMAKTELEELNVRVAPLEEEIRMLLLPADPEDEKRLF